MSFDSLKRALPDKVFTPGTEQYNASLQSYYTAFERSLSPGTIVRPETAEEVSTIVKLARDETLQLAIKGGGAMPWAGAANINGGVTVDLENISGVTLSADNKTVQIGAGERWGNVFRILHEKGLATVGGRIPIVGVVGLILGGGISYFSGKYGFVADAVLSFEVVLSSGDIVIASPTSNPDLFAALKGGSNNFGIVTRVELPTFPQGPMWGGMTFHPGAVLPALVQALVEFTSLPDPDEDANILLAYGWSAQFGMDMACISLYHVNPPESEDSPASLKAFASVEPKLQGSYRNDTLISFTEEQYKNTPPGGRVLYFTVTFKADIALILQIRDLILETVETIKDVKDLVFPCVMQPLTQDFLRKSAQAGPNALGLSPEDAPLILFECNPCWTGPEEDERIEKVTLAFISKVEALAKQAGKEARWRYLGYCHGTQKPIESYGEESIRKMREVSKKYDPTGFFQKMVPGGFKLNI